MHGRAYADRPCLGTMWLPTLGVRRGYVSRHPTPGGGHLSETLPTPLSPASGSGTEDDTGPGHTVRECRAEVHAQVSHL